MGVMLLTCHGFNENVPHILKRLKCLIRVYSCNIFDRAMFIGQSF